MPANAPAIKKSAVREYGGRIVECEPTLTAREDAAANSECRLAGEIETGDHVVFVGVIVAGHVNETPFNGLTA